MTAQEIRKRFLDFFALKEHRIVCSDSLVPKDDPTLLFTSAGMNQFKKQFLGQVGDFRRAATCQKCLRTDDLDKVGKTAFHHTFFEMLGNFSFGDYFKSEAIVWAWEFLTQELNIPAEKLWVSVYIEDNEALKIWQDKIKIPPQRILALGDKDNFWPAEAKTKGPNGPCGPCSEIFFDYGLDCGCKRKECVPTCDCGRFSEVWNLVFTQFQRKDGGVLEALPDKNIDTGMGLERLSAVMQGVLSNFDTDLFKPLISSLKKEADIAKPNEEQLLKIKIIADHIRAITFAICDGVNPSNEDRGYVVRKLIRIGVNNYRALGIKKPFLNKIVPAVVDNMKETYPELKERRENIAQIIKREEESFLKIVETQDNISRERMKTLEKEYQDKKILALKMAEFAFERYDTYGYPYELIEASADKLNIPIDRVTFDKLMQEQKQRSREASAMLGDVFVDPALKLNIAPTQFAGYKNFAVEAKIIKLFNSNNKEIQSTEGLNEIKIILDKTCFYGESGGQVGDSGAIEKDNAKIIVSDAKNINGVIVHLTKSIKGLFKLEDKVMARFDEPRRLSIARNHTATHLLQAALRKVLGEHVQQQGSFVAEERLRFDFTHFQALEKKELERIEDVVNNFIFRNDTLEVAVMPFTKAKEKGALAFFTEKYAEQVRVVSIANYSQELCGGTHLNSTGQIGLFKIISESSIAQGIRRIEATSGMFALKLIKQKEETLERICQILNTDSPNLVSRIEKETSDIKDLEKKIASFKLKLFHNSIAELIKKSPEIKGIKIIVEKIEDIDAQLLPQMIDLIKLKANSAVITLGAIKEGKAFLAVGVSDGLVKKGLNASEIIKDISEIISGKGGGRPHLAEAGGTDTSKLSEALKKAPEIIKGKINL